jgi:hypothetical protein
MNYAVFFFDGRRRREWSLSMPVGSTTDIPAIWYDCVFSIIQFNPCAVVYPVLWERVYSIPIESANYKRVFSFRSC